MGSLAARAIDRRPWPFAIVRLPLASLKHPSADEVRAEVLAMSEERGVSLSALSLMPGRHAGYLQKFGARGLPRRLAEDDRRHLAMFLGMDERRLGARDPWSPVG